MTHFDLAIIGSGSGNSLPDERFADMKVASMIEAMTKGRAAGVTVLTMKYSKQSQ